MCCGNKNGRYVSGILDMGHRRENRTYETLNVGRVDVYATKARIKDIS